MQSNIESIEKEVRAHDQFQVEIKLDYELIEDVQTRYIVETYIFAPQTLGVSETTYTKSDFYRDKQNYIRLKTPTMLLRDFTESEISPLTTIEKIISQPDWVNNSSNLKPLNTNFKLLAAMLNSAIREHLQHITLRIEDLPPNGKAYLIVDNLVEEFLTASEKIAQSYRTLFPTFNLPHVAESLLTAYRLTDESISILFEEGLVELVKIVDSYSKKSAKPDFKMRILERIKAETKHRRHFGYESILHDDDDNEIYLYRASVLKKHAASVLFLRVDIQPDGQSWTHISQAIAAGIAMIFATTVAFLFQTRYGNITFPLFIALVVGYMFKDRIKEIGRELFAQRLRSYLHDHKITICTQDGVKLGVLKEKFDFVTEKQLPRLVLQMRNQDKFSVLDNDGRGENIIRHSKEIILYSNVFKKIFGEAMQISGINDILRYDIRAYLKKMGEPVQRRHFLSNNELHPIDCHKVYHLNIVSRYRSFHPQKDKIHSRTRLVLDQTGIRRMESI